MIDIVHELRGLAIGMASPSLARDTVSRAANKIERLEAALQPFANIAKHYKGHDDDGAVVVGLREIFAAQRALTEGTRAVEKLWQCPRCGEHFHQRVITDGVEVCPHRHTVCPAKKDKAQTSAEGNKAP